MVAGGWNGVDDVGEGRASQFDVAHRSRAEPFDGLRTGRLNKRGTAGRGGERDPLGSTMLTAGGVAANRERESRRGKLGR
jgi:hypothetical protein